MAKFDLVTGKQKATTVSGPWNTTRPLRAVIAFPLLALPMPEPVGRGAARVQERAWSVAIAPGRA